MAAATPARPVRASARLNAIGRAGIDDDGYRAGNARLRLEDLDRDGLAASVVYGPLAIGLPIEDPTLQAACFAAWNDWAADDFNAVAPDRLTTLPFLPSSSAQVAADELERCAAKGHRGAIIDVFDMDLGDPAWDRLWNVAQDTGLPISVHIKGGSWSGLSYQIGKWQAAAFATIMPLQLDEILATLIFSGILERHPGLQIVMAESGVSWLPFFLARADMEWNALKSKLDYAPKLSPSELFARQVFATFEEEFFPEQIPVLGADRCMWASDYPHTDSTFPESRTRDRRDPGRAVRGRPPQGHRDELRRAVRVREPFDRATISGFDHVSLPLRDADAMAAFYRALGVAVDETEHLVVVHFGDQMVNFHREEMWTRDDFTLRAPAAIPPCGDFCMRWEGSADELDAVLRAARASRSRRGRSRGAAHAASRPRACTSAIPTATWSNS